MSGSLSEWQAGREAEASTDRARAFHRLYLRLRIDDQLHYYQERRTEYATAKLGRPDHLLGPFLRAAIFCHNSALIASV